MKSNITYLAFLSLAPYVLGQSPSAIGPSPAASAACQQISQGTAETAIWPLGLTNVDYLDAKNHYYSSANADLTPACAVFPTSAAEVSYVVSVLLNYPNVTFAVKAGGHNTNVGFSSVNWGVLISLSKLASTTLSLDHSTADVGPGARWAEVMTALAPYSLAVVGGRIGDVGVGGLLLGGGLSFLSAQYGLGCNNIVNYEVVLSNATIVNANATSNTDLFWALKGGGNQFGIVTKFTLKTYPVGLVWGGTRTYPDIASSAVLNATQKFIQNNNDPKAAVIVTGNLVAQTLVRVWVVFFFYNGTAPPPGVFDDFNAIIPLVDQVILQPYASLLTLNNEANLSGLRYLYRAVTIPNLPGVNGTDLYNAVYNRFVSVVTGAHALIPDFVFSLALQPLTTLISQASVDAGGDALALDPRNGDRLWIDLSVSWGTAAGDLIADAIMVALGEEINRYSKRTYPGVRNTRYIQGNLAYEEYNPLYSNDAMFDQKPYQTYGGGSFARLKAIQKKVDPIGFFPKRTGGFKYT